MGSGMGVHSAGTVPRPATASLRDGIEAGAGASPPTPAATLDVVKRLVRHELEAVRAELKREGMPPFGDDGQFIRPLLALAGVADRFLPIGAAPFDAPAARSADGNGTSPVPAGFWHAVAAVQLAHEASLVHDDVVDEASERRGAPSFAARHGIGAALLHGDHLLTSAYRMAAVTRSADFQAAFARAGERTVAGEAEQGRRRGEVLSAQDYRAIVLGKSGELLGCALAAGSLIAGTADSGVRYELGRRLGLAYQMLDDLLDYCPSAGTGKPPLRDYARSHWTWVLDGWAGARFGMSDAAVLAELYRPDGGGSAMDRALRRYERICVDLAREAALELPGDVIVTALLDSWYDRARRAVLADAAVIAAPAAEVVGQAAAGEGRGESLRIEPSDRDWGGSMAIHGRSFHFAARWMPGAQRARIERVYAYCRFTDDLADGVDARGNRAAALARLDRWEALSAAAYSGRPTGLAALDFTMREMADAGVPFECAAELIEGMRMDVRGTEYATHAELRVYTYRVAGVVGVWLSRMCGLHAEAVLERAALLGHAMQLTNILRDVGEDLAAGRVYIPSELLAAHGLNRAAVAAMAASGRIEPEWAGLVEQLLRQAERAYDDAFAAIPALPGWFQPPVAIAAHVYRGIHDGIRANGYDNLTRRATTSLREKATCAGRALLGLRRAKRAWVGGRRPSVAAAHPALLSALIFTLAGTVTAPTALAQEACGMTGPAEYLERAEQVAGASPRDPAALLDVVRGRYFLAVEHRDYVETGHRALDHLHKTVPVGSAGELALRDGYRGALIALQARHGRWPPQRLRDVQRGLALLDDAVARDPGSAEIRYLRLVTGFYLPGLFGRGATVREDFRALAALLPTVSPSARPPAFPAIVRFVLEHGDLPVADRRRLAGLADAPATGGFRCA
jgi:15-cis-phytoene synthase